MTPPSFTLDAPDYFTAGTVGPAGQRVFYLQARSGDDLVTVIVEKQQVELLSSSILELLATLDIETGPGPDESQMDLEEPVEGRWRAGRLAWHGHHGGPPSRGRGRRPGPHPFPRAQPVSMINTQDFSRQRTINKPAMTK